MGKIELELCPFCGREALRYDTYGTVYHPRDSSCWLAHYATTEEQWNRRAKPASDDWQSEIREIARTKMEFINSHKEELVTAFIAKTGLQPDECTLCIQEIRDSLSVTTTRYWVERKIAKPEVPSVPEMPNANGTIFAGITDWLEDGDGTLATISTFGYLLALHEKICGRTKEWDQWLRACDAAGCTAAQVVEKLREAGTMKIERKDSK